MPLILVHYVMYFNIFHCMYQGRSMLCTGLAGTAVLSKIGFLCKTVIKCGMAAFSKAKWFCFLHSRLYIWSNYLYLNISTVIYLISF